jgi:hypothetical protein
MYALSADVCISKRLSSKCHRFWSRTAHLSYVGKNYGIIGVNEGARLSKCRRFGHVPPDYLMSKKNVFIME